MGCAIGPKDGLGRRASERCLRGVVVGVLLVLAGCGGHSHPNLPAGAERVALSDFPVGIGSGYPLGFLVQGGEAPRLGESPPDFAMLLPDGRYTTLAELRGRPVLINFWATWCPPCRAEIPELLDAAQAYPELAILAVNVSESAVQVSSFAEQFRMKVPVVMDPQGEISDLYGVNGLPTTLFLDAGGRVLAVRPGAIDRRAIDEMMAVALQ